MVKIGILTTYYSENYGAALQAYALQQALTGMGREAQLIRYRNQAPSRCLLDMQKENKAQESLGRMIKRRLKNLKVKLFGTGIRPEDRMVRHKAFARFEEDSLLLSKERFSSPEEFMKFAASSSAGYDLYICGSDQVWNPLVHHFDPVYLLDFPTKAKRVSYAPSIALNNLSEAETKRLAASVRKLDQISVREKDALQLLKPYLLEKTVQTVADPTFLLERKDWERLGSKKKLPESYVLVYMLEYNANPKDAVKRIRDYALKHQAQVICLPYTKLRFGHKLAVQEWYDVAPNDFIPLLLHAKCIFTNSFHATALSINNNKEFYVFLQSAENGSIQSRITNLLETFHLQDRGVTEDSPYSYPAKPIDYSAVNKKIKELRADGYAYLKSCMGGNANEG